MAISTQKTAFDQATTTPNIPTTQQVPATNNALPNTNLNTNN